LCKHPTCPTDGPCRRPVKPGIKKMSAKRAKQNTLYLQKRNAFLKANPFCQAKIIGCQRIADQIHHMRGRDGDLLSDERYFLAVCQTCHRDITDDSKMAIERGFSLTRITDLHSSYPNSEI